MPADIRDRVFEPFFTTKPSGVGTGLGLAICQNIVTSLRGELTVRNLPGRGAAFRVFLPVGPPPAPTSSVEQRSVRTGTASHHSAPPFLSDRRHRILVIDDEMALAYAIRRALASEYEVELAGGSTEGFRRIAQGPAFDAILCDVVMPAVDGIEFFVQLKRTRPDLASRLIFMTGAASMPRVEEFLASVANPSIDKPLDLDRLRKLLAETCANSFSGDPCVNY
jgi:CheY-like chemotaxis protein